jgi:hypothetical protein
VRGLPLCSMSITDPLLGAGPPNPSSAHESASFIASVSLSLGALMLSYLTWCSDERPCGQAEKNSPAPRQYTPVTSNYTRCLTLPQQGSI